MSGPNVFISHRHADKAIAKTVADFIDERSSGAATIFCSSSVDFAPVAGDSLELSLKAALAACDVVVLVFTSDTEDWSYCMWECGLATDPADKRLTRVVVLQCGDTSPKPYGDHLRVDLRNLESVTGFVKTMLTTTEYFPTQDRPLTNFTGDGPKIKEFAATLHADLDVLLSSLHHEDVEERSASTYLCVELEREAVERLRALHEAPDRAAAAELIRNHTRIASERGARSLFTFHVDDKTTLGKIVDEWTSDGNGSPADRPTGTGEPQWFESLVDQIVAVVAGRFPVVKWAPYDVEPSKAVIPYVAGCRTVPSTGGLQLQVYFVPMSPRPVPVAERMIVPESMFHKNLADTPGESIKLAELLAEMKADGRSRVPMLGESGAPRFMVHKSMIQEFVSDRALNDQIDVRDLTVHDLLVDGQTAEIVRRTFAVVDRTADMDQALAAMNSIPGCQDVFVTTDGTSNGTVVGWLTNTMFMS